MEYYLDHAVFNAPTSLRDITVYTFGKPDKSELLEVHNSEREATLDQLAAEITDQADALGMTLAEERNTRLDDMPARVLSFAGEEYGKSFRQFFVLATVPPSAQQGGIKHLEIKYLTKSDAAAANAVLERIIKSARRGSAQTDLQNAGDFKRRSAGIITLEIPSEWRGGGFQFNLREDSPVITDESVTFEISEVQTAKNAKTGQTQPDAPMNDSEAEMEEDINTDLNSGGQILERQTKNSSANGISSTILSYAVNNAPPWEKDAENKLIRRAYLKVSETVEVRVVGRANNRKRQNLEENFNQIVNSVKERK